MRSRGLRNRATGGGPTCTRRSWIPSAAMTEVARATAATLIAEARAAQLAGDLRAAADGYARAIDVGHRDCDQRAAAEGLRRLAVVHHLLSEPKAARDYAEDSLRLAHDCG